MKRIFALMICLALAACMLTACGDDDIYREPGNGTTLGATTTTPTLGDDNGSYSADPDGDVNQTTDNDGVMDDIEDGIDQGMDDIGQGIEDLGDDIGQGIEDIGDGIGDMVDGNNPEINGANGVNGTDGMGDINGMNGADGANGMNGTNGMEGSNGEGAMGGNATDGMGNGATNGNSH